MSNAAMIIVPTDISEKVREIEVAYARYLEEFRIPEDHKIVVNFSAGKDSTTTATVAHHLFGDRVQNVMADTDNEHDLTVDFARNIHLQIGCKPVQIVKRINAYRELLAYRRNSPVIPDGYVMVPKEPTQAMCAAFNDSDYGRKSLRERYVAMLAAAPQEVK